MAMSCTKSDPNSNTENCITKKTDSLDGSVLSYFGDFKRGTYWVYYDSIGEKDSSYVGDYMKNGGGTYDSCISIDGNVTVGQRPSNEQIFIDINSSNISDLSENITCSNTGLANLGFNGNGPGGPYIDFSLSESRGVYSSDNPSGVLSTYDSLVLGGILFKNVIEVNESAKPTSYILYFAKNLGMVAKTINNKTYILKRYNIVH